MHAVKQNAGVKYAGTDIGMNVFVRPSMYDSWHDVEILRDGKTVDRDDLQEITLVGNICESGDIIAKDRPRPAEVLICKDGTVKQIRRRETVEDLFRYFE